MDRRAFLKTGTLVSAGALTGLPRLSLASAPGQWRVFEVTTQAESVSSFCSSRAPGGSLTSRRQRVMKQSEIVVHLKLGRGNQSTSVWTTDFSHDYVSINADYRS